LDCATFPGSSTFNSAGACQCLIRQRLIHAGARQRLIYANLCYE